MSEPAASHPSNTTAAAGATASSPFPLASPPWECRCNVYWILFRTQGGRLPQDAYSPLEAASDAFSQPSKAGAFRGGLGLVMLLRYKETPLGPYNEMVFIPGAFDVPGQRGKTSRVTRIYVDQKETTYNGRLAWNLPKHVVRFVWTELSNPSRLRVQVFPPANNPTASTPFFTATLRPRWWSPALPFTSKPLITQPPLPASGKAGEEELVGTEKWARSLFVLSCKKAKLCSVEVEQPPRGEGEEATLAKWWPPVNAWKIGLSLEDSRFLLNAAAQF